jgi:thiol:disulfide interchange protein DsbD
LWIALELHIRDGWHTYWRNPGDSGLATRLSWALATGYSADDIQWTAPHRFEVGPLVNYGYAGHATHLVRITVPKDSHTGSSVVFAAKASWLVCSDVCIPESAQLRLKLPVGSPTGSLTGNKDPKVTALFLEARRELPQAAPGTSTARIAAGQVIIRLGHEWGATLSRITSASFFPYDEGAIDYASPQTLTRSADAIELAIKAGTRSQKLKQIRGVLIATEDDGGQVMTVPFEVVAPL